LIIQTIRRVPSRSVLIDEASNVSRPDRSGADQSDVEHQATDLVVGLPAQCAPSSEEMAATARRMQLTEWVVCWPRMAAIHCLGR
jgi:hypothetical protein